MVGQNKGLVQRFVFTDKSHEPYKNINAVSI